MTLIKSKINSLAWLKSAIYISVVGGVILSSKSVSAIDISFSDSRTFSRFSITEMGFGNSVATGASTPPAYWKGTIKVIQNRGLINDVLTVSGLYQHISISSHLEDNSAGRVFDFNFVLDADDATGNEISAEKTLFLGHPLGNHLDLFEAKLTANVSNTLGFNRITNWTFTLSGEHKPEPVPEPTTIFGSALALGVGGWLKRKKSSQQNKTTSH
jgi:hypothetical protein